MANLGFDAIAFFVLAWLFDRPGIPQAFNIFHAIALASAHRTHPRGHGSICHGPPSRRVALRRSRLYAGGTAGGPDERILMSANNHNLYCVTIKEPGKIPMFKKLTPALCSTSPLSRCSDRQNHLSDGRDHQTVRASRSGQEIMAAMRGRGNKLPVGVEIDAHRALVPLSWITKL